MSVGASKCDDVACCDEATCYTLMLMFRSMRPVQVTSTLLVAVVVVCLLASAESSAIASDRSIEDSGNRQHLLSGARDGKLPDMTLTAEEAITTGSETPRWPIDNIAGVHGDRGCEPEGESVCKSKQQVKQTHSLDVQ